MGIEFHWNFEETLLASHALSSSDKHGLKELAIKYLDYPDIDEKKLKKKVLLARNRVRGDWKIAKATECDYWLPGQVFPEDKSLEDYAYQDAERTMLLWLLYEPLLKKLNLYEGYEKEKELLRVVYKMETDGITINMDRLNEIQDFLSLEANKCSIRAKFTARKRGYTNLKLDSNKDLKELLFTKEGFNLPIIKRTEKGNVSTDKEVINTLYENTEKGTDEYKFLKQMLTRRAYLTGFRYLEGYRTKAYQINDEWYRLYPSLNQSGTQTTRFSSSNPNGQNVSKKDEKKIGQDTVLHIPKLRDVFGPMPGKTWYAIDYSQLELRVFAAVSKEQALIDALDSGYDFHGYVASRIFRKSMDKISSQERTIAKNTNFALIFGASPRKVNQTAGIPNAYELFSGQFPNAAQFMESTIRKVSKIGYVTTLDGYRLDIPLEAPYKAVNYLVQGTAGRIVKNAMLKINREAWFDWENIRLVLQIHDELIVETLNSGPYNTPRYINRIVTLMLEAGLDMGINTPASCNRITTDWGHGEEIVVTDNEFQTAA